MKLIVDCAQKLQQLGERVFNEKKQETYEPIDEPTIATDFTKEHGIPCPDGYIFKDENGNVINATKIVLEKKKKEYPKTYEECCEIVKVGKAHTLEGEIIRINNYKIALLESFQKLLICRDAYWKIAGDEMGLGKPWEPKLDNNEIIYYIYNVWGKVYESEGLEFENQIFAFPTAEMRDAFYENFKSEIESVKELL